MNAPGSGPPPADAPVWCQAPFDPEGVLSSVSAVLSCFIGIHFGHVLVHYQVRHVARCLQSSPLQEKNCIAYL